MDSVSVTGSRRKPREVFAKLGIEGRLGSGETFVVELPAAAGGEEMRFTCGMGMHQRTVVVPGESSLCIHHSWPSVVGPQQMEGRHAATGKPYGFLGIGFTFTGRGGRRQRRFPVTSAVQGSRVRLRTRDILATESQKGRDPRAETRFLSRFDPQLRHPR